MDLLRFSALSLLGLSLSFAVGCANQQSLTSFEKPQHNKTPQEGSPLPNVSLNEGDLLLKVTKDGEIELLTEKGANYTRCGEEGSNENICRIFKGDITVTGLDEVSFTRLRYTGSGECEVISFIIRKGNTMERVYMYNPNDRDCFEHHR